MRFIGRTTGLLLAALVSLAGCKGGVAPSDAGAPTPGPAAKSPAPAAAGSLGRIACDVPEHDWGSITAGQEVNHTFVVKNVGDGVLRILNARGG